MTHRNFVPLLCFSTVLLTGIGLGVFGWSRAKTDVQLDRRNAVIEGKVVDGFISTGMRGGKWSHLVVEYHPTSHAPIRRKFDVDGTTYNSAMETSKAAVTYFPEDPQISRVTRFAPLPYQILMWLGGAMALGGLIGLGCILKAGVARD